MYTNNKNSSGDVLPNVLKWSLIFIPVIIYTYFVAHYSLNLPWWDDYDAVLHYMCRFREMNRMGKPGLLFEQHNEHRIFSSRLIIAAYYYLMQGLNFRGLILIGNLQLLGVFLFLVHFIKKFLPNHWFIAAFVTSVCLFDLSHWGIALFAQGALQNYGVIFLFVGSLFFYSKNNDRYIIPAVLFQIAVTFSSGNGMVASLFICLYNLPGGSKKRKIAGVLTFLLFSPLYFVHFKGGTIKPEIATFVSYFVRFMGAQADFSSNLVSLGLGVIVALGLLLTLPVVGKISIVKDSSPFLVIAGFALVTMLMTALFRGGDNYPDSRYLIYSHLLGAVLFIFITRKLSDTKIVKPAAVGLTAFYLLFYWKNFEPGKQNFSKYHDEIANSVFAYPKEAQEWARTVTNNSCRLNIYCIEQHRLVDRH